MDTLLRDLRYLLRSLRSSPVFSAVVILIAAYAFYFANSNIGACTLACLLSVCGDGFTQSSKIVAL